MKVFVAGGLASLLTHSVLRLLLSKAQWHIAKFSLMILSNEYPFAWVSITSQTFYIILFWPN